MDTESIRAAITRLEPGQSQTLRLASQRGMTYGEVAEALGRTPADVCRELRVVLGLLRLAA